MALLTSANLRLFRYKGGGQVTRLSAIAFLALPVMFLAFVFIWKGSDLKASDAAVGLCGVAGYMSARYWQIGGATRLLWFAACLSPLVVVGIAAAINAGL